MATKDIEEASEIEINYFFDKNYWGKGYASEAAKAMLDYGHKTLGHKHIVATIHPDNKASIQVALKTGMIKEKQITSASGNLRDLYVSLK